MYNDSVAAVFNILPTSSSCGIIHCRGGSRAAATPKMERFVVIVNGWKPLTVITKRTILDIAAALDPPLHCSYQHYQLGRITLQFSVIQYLVATSYKLWIM